MGHLGRTTSTAHLISAQDQTARKETNIPLRDVTIGGTGATIVAPKFSDAFTPFQPGGGEGGKILPLHSRGRTIKLSVVTSLPLHNYVLWAEM